ncbi:hypothetical protein [Streptodolium elevatio]|uniref:Helix-turn-helix domain-containing protein n=1 Tax=Streptodolium elevatio TaxID=3157996 RepID=A0ABV3DR28_9ACTN
MTVQTLTMREAAGACGVSLSTIRRRREAGHFPGAALDEAGWTIPVVDLAAAGLTINAAPTDATRDDDSHDDGDLRRQLAAARAEADHLRALLASKDAHLTDVRALLRIFGGPTPTPPAETAGAITRALG